MKAKTRLQLEIIQDAQNLDPSIKAYTSKEFVDNEKLRQLEEYYKKLKQDAPIESFLETKTKQQALLHRIVGLEFDENSIFENDLSDVEIYESTKGILSISNKILIREIMHVLYAEACDNPHPYSDGASLKRRIDKWARYCKQVDIWIDFIKKLFPDWKTMGKKEKNDYVDSLQSFLALSSKTKQEKLINSIEELENYLIEQRNEDLSNCLITIKEELANPNKDLEEFIEFLENYSLNQRIKAMADFLLNLNLPNITSFEIAKKVCENSNFTNKIIFK